MKFVVVLVVFHHFVPASASKSFQKFAHYLMRSMRGTHTHTHTYISLCVCKEQKDQTRFRHIRHSMLRFVSCCCCCCLFYHLTIFSECLHPKNNFVEQLFLVGCRSRKITAHILTLSVSPRIHTHRHIQTKSGMHKL